MTSPDATDALCAALDALIPGDGIWPNASSVVNASDFVAALSPEDRRWLSEILTDVTDFPAMWRGVEERPEFQRLLRALYDAYYSAPATQAQIRRLAEASPGDPDTHFDPTLLKR